MKYKGIYKGDELQEIDELIKELDLSGELSLLRKDTGNRFLSTMSFVFHHVLQGVLGLGVFCVAMLVFGGWIIPAVLGNMFWAVTLGIVSVVAFMTVLSVLDGNP